MRARWIEMCDEAAASKQQEKREAANRPKRSRAKQSKATLAHNSSAARSTNQPADQLADSCMTESIAYASGS